MDINSFNTKCAMYLDNDVIQDCILEFITGHMPGCQSQTPLTGTLYLYN